MNYSLMADLEIRIRGRWGARNDYAITLTGSNNRTAVLTFDRANRDMSFETNTFSTTTRLPLVSEEEDYNVTVRLRTARWSVCVTEPVYDIM